MKKEDKIKIYNKKYNKDKNNLFNLYFIENKSITEIVKILNLTKNRFTDFVFRLKQDFLNIIKIKKQDIEYCMMWCDNEDYPTAKSCNILGYSNEYKKFTYRVLNYKQLKK